MNNPHNPGANLYDEADLAVLKVQGLAVQLPSFQSDDGTGNLARYQKDSY